MSEMTPQTPPPDAVEVVLPPETAARLETIGLTPKEIVDAEILDICSNDDPTFGVTGETFGAARIDVCDPYAMDEDDLVYIYGGELPFRSDQFTHVTVTSGPLVGQLGKPEMFELSADMLRVLKINGNARIRNGFGDEEPENDWTPEEILEAQLQNEYDNARVRVRRVLVPSKTENAQQQHYVILEKLPVTGA